MTYAIFNTARPALQKREVREALMLAFPFDAMARKVLRGFSRVPTSHLPRGIEGFDTSLPPFRQDLERAKQRLAQAGIGSGQLSLKFVYVPGFEEIRIAAELWKEALKKIGVNLDIETATFAALASVVAKRETAPDTTVLLGGTEVADPASYLATWGHSRNAGQQWNWAYFENAKFDQLTEAAAREADAGRRADLIHQAQRLLRAELPFFPIYAPSLTEAMRSRVAGWQPSPADNHSIVRFYDLTLQGP
jgi:ABC-type transport system substrate-binding protein